MADWATKEAGAEGPSRICVEESTPISLDKRRSTVLEVHNVQMDGLLNQPAHKRSANGKNLCISYKITSTHNATKTLDSLLAFLTNLAGWKPGQSPCQANQAKLVKFLEQAIQKLVSTAGRDWQHKFKGHKHIGLAVLVKVQQIIAKFALATRDPDVKEWNFEDGPMMYDGNLDLQEASIL